MAEKRKDVLQPIDAQARRLARTLLRTARFAALATIDTADGAPVASRVAIATAMSGEPVFLISTLASHTSNLAADQRCSIMVGEPGKGDQLAHARLTVVGHAERLQPGTERDRIRARYLMRHPKSALYVDFADFGFWRLNVERAALNGGFGKAFALQSVDLLTSLAGITDLAGGEATAVAHMNEEHAGAVDHYAARLGGQGKGWRLACLDPEGLDLARGDEPLRLWFDAPLQNAADLRPTLVTLARAGVGGVDAPG